ncbi:MAG: TIM barrel protein [Pirellulaceae bacterium]|nr:TIM barrel protein [Pirellulaceae bacterium]
MLKPSKNPNVSRRIILQGAAAVTVGGGASWISHAPTIADDQNKATGRINQSIVQWCFGSRGEKWNLAKTCSVARELGYQSVELVSPDAFPTLKQHGLTCAIVGTQIQPGPAFMRGYNNPNFHPMVLKATREAIDAAAANGYDNVIAFTGFRAKDPTNPDSECFSDEEGAANCVEGFKQIVGYAEKQGVTICLEMLNTRDDSDPMRGHPGYQGDSTDYCIDIIKAVGSDRLKLLFDIYHVQIMDGDVIRRIRQYKDYIGHVHTAGNPGRGELDQDQEINYPAVMKALLEAGYSGFVGQEFIPTRNPYQGLKEAFQQCDV